MRKKYFFILFPILIFGCASNSRNLVIDPVMPWSSYQIDQSGKVRSEFVSSNSLTDLQLGLQLTARNNYITGLKATHKSIENKASKLFEEIRDLADQNSETSLAVSTVGILSGITATALVVASPANSVWVAGFTGASTGALGYQTRLAQEGFTRDAVQREFERLASEYKAANAEFGEALAILQVNLNSTDLTEWNGGIAKAEKSLNEMETLVTLGYLPAGIVEDLEKIKMRDEEILNQIKILQNQNNELKKKVEALEQSSEQNKD